MLKLFLGLMVLLCTTSIYANIIITGTHFIYPSQEKTIAVELSNPDPYPALTQSWLERGEQSDAKSKIPFIITPALVRIEPQSKQTLRIRYTGEPLPKDRESLFYLNILDIPAKPKGTQANANYLQFTFKNRLKFFYRPHLPYSVEHAYDKVLWTINGNVLTINNLTPYYITYASVALESQGTTVYETSDDIDMVAPFSTYQLHLKDIKATPTHVKWHIINDYGVAQSGISSL